MSVPTVSLQTADTRTSHFRLRNACSSSSTTSFPTQPLAEKPFVHSTSVEWLMAFWCEGYEKVKPSLVPGSGLDSTMQSARKPNTCSAVPAMNSGGKACFTSLMTSSTPFPFRRYFVARTLLPPISSAIANPCSLPRNDRGSGQNTFAYVVHKGNQHLQIRLLALQSLVHLLLNVRRDYLHALQR